MNRTANPIRGEASVVVDGVPYVLRPSFEALVAAEDELGSLFAMVERAAQGSLSITEMSGLIWHCIAPENRPERARVGEALLATGLLEAAKPVRTIFAQVLKGTQ